MGQATGEEEHFHEPEACWEAKGKNGAGDAAQGCSLVQVQSLELPPPESRRTNHEEHAGSFTLF